MICGRECRESSSGGQRLNVHGLNVKDEELEEGTGRVDERFEPEGQSQMNH